MENIFLGFLNRSITAGWLILAVMALRMLLKRSPKWIHCLLWALVAFRLVCPLSLESVFSLIPSRETVRRDMAVSSEPVVDSGVRFVDNAVNRAIRETAAPRPEMSADPLQIWLFAASVIWIAGVAAMLLYALAAYVRLWLKVRTAVRLEGPVMLSEFVKTPFLSGIARPRIYLPADMPEGMRAPVIAHEMAHLKRRDNLWKILGYALLAAYWFHPLCWAAYILLCRDIERACDEKVIRGYDMHQRKLYSEALLACSMERRAGLACPLAFGEIGVTERIKSVLRYKKPAFWAIAAAVVICVVAGVCFLTDPVTKEEGIGGAALAGADNGNGASGGAGGTMDARADDAGTGTGGSKSGDDERADRQGSAEREQEPGGNAVGDREDTGNPVSGNSMDATAAYNGGLTEEFVNQWAQAFVDRDGNAIQSFVSEEAGADLEERDMLYGPSGQRRFGISSPWPWNMERDVRINSVSPENAVIYYYAWTSDPHVTVWKESISYQWQEGRYVVIGEELAWLDDISRAETFGETYGYYGISDSAMDYEANGVGEALNDNALSGSTRYYRNLFEPESAAVELLNLSDDSAKVQIERVYEESGSVNLRIRFLEEEDDLPMLVTIVQPYGPEGIWIPKDYKIDVMDRFMRLSWGEIRSRSLAVTDPGIWRDVVCIAEIPEESIKIYGYNDEECFGEGVAIEIGDDVNYFDWIYTSPQCRLPECYWNQADRQLQVALNVYTGTGAAAQALHLLQYDDDNVLQDYALELDEMQEMLYERIGYFIGEDKKSLFLIDKKNHEQLGQVDIEEHKGELEALELELGMISSYSLGESIRLLVEPGYYLEGAAIAEYPDDMPTLEVEVLPRVSSGKIRFIDFGEIRGDPVEMDFMEYVE